MFFDRLTDFDFSLVTNEELAIMLIGYLIVFLVLASFYLVFQNLKRILDIGFKTVDYLKKGRKSLVEAAEKTMAQNGVKQTSTEEKAAKVVLSGETNAAISAAIYMYIQDNMHDDESTILTIEKVSRRYSPWSSKIYSVTNLRR